MCSERGGFTRVPGRRSEWRQFGRRGGSVLSTGRRPRGTSNSTVHRWNCTRSVSVRKWTSTSSVS